MPSSNNRALSVTFHAVVMSVLLTTMPISSAAEIPELITDRPDQTESTATVPYGMIQIESGFLMTDTGASTVLEFPGTLVRVGVHEKVEVRIGTAGWIRNKDFDLDGVGDSELGFKVKLRDEAGWMPESAILAGLSVPTGDDNFSTEEWDPFVRFAAAHTISDMVSFGWNVALEWESSLNGKGDTVTLAAMPYSGVFGFGIDEQIGVFAELFGELPVNNGGDPAHMFDSGITYLIRDNFQLDGAIGFGLNDSASDWFVLAGITYRLPQ